MRLGAQSQKPLKFIKISSQNIMARSSSFEASKNFQGLDIAASVVMSQGFGYPAFPVDTLFIDLLKMAYNGKSVAKTEKDLKSIRNKDWNKLHCRLFWGREFCQARVCARM